MNNIIDSVQIALIIVIIVQIIYGLGLSTKADTAKATFYALVQPFTFVVFAVALAVILENR